MVLEYPSWEDQWYSLKITAWRMVAQTVKNLSAAQEIQVWSLGREDPLQKRRAAHSNILAWEIAGQRGLAACSPWLCKEWDTTEWLTLALSFTEDVARLANWITDSGHLYLHPSRWVRMTQGAKQGPKAGLFGQESIRSPDSNALRLDLHSLVTECSQDLSY